MVAISLSTLLADEVGDLRDDAVVAALADAVGQLADDDRASCRRAAPRCARGARMTIRPRPERYASRIPSRPRMIAAGREVGALDVLA